MSFLNKPLHQRRRDPKVWAFVVAGGLLLIALSFGISMFAVYGIYASITAFVEERVLTGTLWGALAYTAISINVGIAQGTKN